MPSVALESEKKVKRPALPEGTREATKLREEAKEHYGQMQRSWFFFAKSIKDLRDKEAYKVFEFNNFQEFCESEYPTVNFSTISKFIKIVESWGEAIDSKLKKETDYKLPAYESFYQLTTVEDKVPAAELSKLRKAVLDSKLSYLGLRDKLKGFLDAHRKKIRAEVDHSMDDIEKQLMDDLKEEDLHEPRFPGEEEDGAIDVDSESSEELDEDEEESVIDGSSLALTSRAAYLNDNLPVLTARLKKDGEMTDDSVKLATALEKLQEMIADFLNTAEEVSQ